MYQVYQLRGNANVTLNLLSLDPERKVKCYNMYFVTRHVFHTEEYGQDRKTCNSRICVKRSTFNEFEVDYYRKLEDAIELQYHSEQNTVFLFKCYWYDTINKKIKLNLHHGLVKINTKARLRSIKDIFVFAKQC
jgi:hypothetical protein